MNTKFKTGNTIAHTDVDNPDNRVLLFDFNHSLRSSTSDMVVDTFISRDDWEDEFSADGTKHLGFAPTNTWGVANWDHDAWRYWDSQIGGPDDISTSRNRIFLEIEGFYEGSDTSNLFAYGDETKTTQQSDKMIASYVRRSANAQSPSPPTRSEILRDCNPSIDKPNPILVWDSCKIYLQVSPWDKEPAGHTKDRDGFVFRLNYKDGGSTTNLLNLGNKFKTLKISWDDINAASQNRIELFHFEARSGGGAGYMSGADWSDSELGFGGVGNWDWNYYDLDAEPYASGATSVERQYYRLEVAGFYENSAPNSLFKYDDESTTNANYFASYTRNTDRFDTLVTKQEIIDDCHPQTPPDIPYRNCQILVSGLASYLGTGTGDVKWRLEKSGASTWGASNLNHAQSGNQYLFSTGITRDDGEQVLLDFSAMSGTDAQNLLTLADDNLRTGRTFSWKGYYSFKIMDYPAAGQSVTVGQFKMPSRSRIVNNDGCITVTQNPTKDGVPFTVSSNSNFGARSATNRGAYAKAIASTGEFGTLAGAEGTSNLTCMLDDNDFAEVLRGNASDNVTGRRFNTYLYFRWDYAVPPDNGGNFYTTSAYGLYSNTPQQEPLYKQDIQILGNRSGRSTSWESLANVLRDPNDANSGPKTVRTVSNLNNSSFTKTTGTTGNYRGPSSGYYPSDASIRYYDTSPSYSARFVGESGGILTYRWKFNWKASFKTEFERKIRVKYNWWEGSSKTWIDPVDVPGYTDLNGNWVPGYTIPGYWQHYNDGTGSYRHELIAQWNVWPPRPSHGGAVVVTPIHKVDSISTETMYTWTRTNTIEGAGVCCSRILVAAPLDCSSQIATSLRRENFDSDGQGVINWYVFPVGVNNHISDLRVSNPNPFQVAFTSKYRAVVPDLLTDPNELADLHGNKGSTPGGRPNNWHWALQNWTPHAEKGSPPGVAEANAPDIVIPGKSENESEGRGLFTQPGKYFYIWQSRGWNTDAVGSYSGPLDSIAWRGSEYQSSSDSGTAAGRRLTACRDVQPVHIYADSPTCTVEYREEEVINNNYPLTIKLHNPNSNGAESVKVYEVTLTVSHSRYGSRTETVPLIDNRIIGNSSLTIEFVWPHTLNYTGEWTYTWYVATGMGKEEWTTNRYDVASKQHPLFESYRSGEWIQQPGPCEETLRIVRKPYLRGYLSDISAGGYFGKSVTEDACGILSNERIDNTYANYGYVLGLPTDNSAADKEKFSSSTDLSIRAKGAIHGFASDNLKVNGATAFPKSLSFANDVGTFGGYFSHDRCLANHFRGWDVRPENTGDEYKVIETYSSNTLDLYTDLVTSNNLRNVDTTASANIFNDGAPLPSFVTTRTAVPHVEQYRFTVYRDGDLTLTNSAPSQDLKELKASIYVNGDLYIESDIINSNNKKFSYINNLGYLNVIVRGNIYVQNNVQRLDGVFAAYPEEGETNSGRFYSCVLPSFMPQLKAGTFTNISWSIHPQDQAERLDYYLNCGGDNEPPTATACSGGATLSHFICDDHTLTVRGAVVAREVFLGRINHTLLKHQLVDSTLDIHSSYVYYHASESFSLLPEFIVGTPNLPPFRNWQYRPDSVLVLPINL